MVAAAIGRDQAEHREQALDGQPGGDHDRPEHAEQPQRQPAAVVLAVDEQQRQRIRSAKMKLITPPKLIPPCHSAAARGTLPIEHTKLMMAMNGPTIAFSRLVQKPWPRDEHVFHHVDRAPARSGTRRRRSRSPARVRSIVRSATV